jgi:hypothetical protein
MAALGFWSRPNGLGDSGGKGDSGGYGTTGKAG